MVPVAQLKDAPASPAPRPDIAELRSRVAQIAPQIKARAHNAEKAGRVPEENIAALRNIGYFEIVKPTLEQGFNYKGLTWADDQAEPRMPAGALQAGTPGTP